MEQVISGFKSRQTPLKEDAAKWLATGLENQGGVTLRGSIPPSSATTRSRKVRRCADNTDIGGAVPPWWITLLLKHLL